MHQKGQAQNSILEHAEKKELYIQLSSK